MFSQAQIVTTNPAIITEDYNSVIEVIFDATQGTAGLKDFTGDVYAHTGVFTSLSPSTWKYAPTWGDNSSKYKLTSLGNNKWKLFIAPNMNTYYGISSSSGEKVTKLCFVFRSADKSKEGKDVGGADIVIPVFKTGLNVKFTAPIGNQSVAPGTTIDFSVASTISANLNLLLDNNSVKTANAATSLSYSHTFTTQGDYMLIASATANSTTVYDTIKINVPKPVVSQPRPTGVKTGINYIDNSTVTLVLHAPNKSNVYVIGEFNDWSILNAFQMKKDGEYWWLTISDLTPGKIYSYQYLVDGNIRISDPFTELVLDPWNDKWINEKYMIYPNLKPYPEGKTEGLVATLQTAKPAYNWEVPSFTTPNRENMVIYELILRDFTNEKSIEAAIEKLDYLKNLGITAVELMPIQEFDGNNSWGYNPNHYFAPDKAYGTPDMYKKFIDECHKRGIAVILDIVLNHSTSLHPYAKLWWNSTLSKTSSENPYFNVDAPHPYSVFHDYNHSYSGTKDMFKRMVQYWTNEYKIDGYRLDLTKGFTQNQSSESTASNYDQSRIDILTEYYNAAKAAKNDVMFILEHFCTYNEELELANRGMFLWRNVNNAFSQAAMGYQSDSDFGGLNSTPRRWVGYAESHDEERNFFKAKTYGIGNVSTDSIYRISRVPLNIAFTTLMPGPKMIWQFGEMGYDYSINSLGGRTSSKPAAWSYLNLAHRKAAYDASSKIISLRKLYPKVFNEGTYSMQTSMSDWENGRRISITHNDLNVVVLGNFKANDKTTAFPNFPKTGSWYNLITGQIYYVGYANTPIELQPGQLLIFTDKQINFPSALKQTEANENDCIAYPTITDGMVYFTNQLELKKITLFDLQGKILKTVENNEEINLSEYRQGIYLIKTESLNGSGFHKIIKK